MKRIWVNKANSFENAEKFDRDYYLAMTSAERLETVQLLRERYFPQDPLVKTKKYRKNENRKRLRRVISVVQQA